MSVANIKQNSLPFKQVSIPNAMQKLSAQKLGMPKTATNIFAISVLACVAFAESACANPATIYNPQADTYFNQAERAASSRDAGQLMQYQQQMAGGLLAMYPEYWQLNADLGSQPAAAIINFAQRYAGSVMAEKLAADYAEAKAAQGDYASVRQVAGFITNADASEACAMALGFNQAGDVMRSLVEKPNVWLNTKKQPELCNQLATQLNNNPLISQNDRSDRLYRVLRTGNNGDIVQLTTKLGIPLSYNQLMAVSSNPSGFFSTFNAQPPSATNRYLYLYALGQLAKTSVSNASMQLNYDLNQDKNRAQKLFDDKTYRYAYRTLGVARMGVNTDQGFDVQVVDWMQQSLGEPFNFEESEDYAQAAIRFSRWADVVNAIGTMDTVIQKQPIWQYWLARAYTQVGNPSQKQQARQIFSNLAQKNDYYGLLAKDQIGQRFNQLPRAPSVSSSDEQRLNQDQNFMRAFTLYNLNANPSYTNREWNWAVRKARDKGDTQVIMAAAQRANNMGWYDRAIFAIENTDSLPKNALAYPMPHQDSVVQYSRQAGIDPAWAYGIMRQESRFNVGAKSGVGAGGLMQIMPDTAKYIARKLGETYSASNVATGDTNIRYGTHYMGDIYNKLGAQPVLATAGYNAGPNKAKTWQPTQGTLPADQYVESIPYPETQNYVKAVMENTAHYGVLLGTGNQSMGQRMGTIPPKY